jgi:GDP-L-fucose synthase
MNISSKIFIAGAHGLVGNSLVRLMRSRGFNNLITPTRSTLNLLENDKVFKFLRETKPDFVIVAAAKVGGILYNKLFPAEFLTENLRISINIIEGAHQVGVKKLLFLGSSCIYPKFAEQPITESALLTGALEITNESYAIAKIAGLKLCEKFYHQYGDNFISAMPTNLYGIFDNFHPENSHVIPGMMRKFHQAKINKEDCVTIWGSGKPLREFLHVDDLASALLILLEKFDAPGHVNIGCGEDIAIARLAEIMREVVGYQGDIVFDTTKPDGTPRKLLNVDIIKSFGWVPQIKLKEGLNSTYEWALERGLLT